MGSRSGFNGTATSSPTKLSNEFFRVVLNNEWEPFTDHGGKPQYKAVGKELYILPTDVFFKVDPELQGAAMKFASDNELFIRAFSSAWTKLMTLTASTARLGTCATSLLAHRQASLGGAKGS